MIQTCLWLGGATLLACLLSLVLTPMARTLMQRVGAIDQPDPRRVNRVPVPRGGGLAVILSFFLSIGIVWMVRPALLAGNIFAEFFPWFAGASAILLVVGLWDDIRGLAPITKLVAQLCVAGLLCYGGARLILPIAWGAWVTSPWVYVPLTMAWYVGVINAFNLIDGLDGLSSGLGIIATGGMIGVFFLENSAVIPVVSLVFIGALLGFLRYNYNPASIFLGDTGSLFVGLFLATLTLVTRRSDAFLVSIGIPVLCLGIPLIDTSLAILRRTLRRFLLRREGKKVAGGTMTADRDHVHHRALALAKGSQRRAVWTLYGLALALITLGFCTVFIRESKVAIFLVGFLALASVLIRLMVDIEFWDAGRLLTNPGARIGRRIIVVPLYILADILVMLGIFYGLYLLFYLRLPYYSMQTWCGVWLVYAVPVMVALVLTHSHIRIWGRSTRKDAFLLIVGIGLSSLFSQIVFTWFAPTIARTLCPFHILWVLTIPLPMYVTRLAKTSFLQWMAYIENCHNLSKSQADASIDRILFYGAGINLESYIRIFEINVTRNNEALVGILDDNRGLRGRIFHSLKIYGPLEILNDKQRFNELRPTHIIVTTPAVGAKRLAKIRAFCKKHNMRLTRCTLQTETLL